MLARQSFGNAGNISRWWGDLDRWEAQDPVLAALNTRCWQSMVKENAPHESDAWAAFEGEVLPHADRLFRLAMWFERNRADAEDVVQETMMQALRSFHRFQPGTNCRAWLTTILQHIVSNRRRAKGRSIVVSDPDDGNVRRAAAARRSARPARPANSESGPKCCDAQAGFKMLRR